MNNFTPKARKLFLLTRHEVDRLAHEYAGTEHLVFGLLALGQCSAVGILQKMGVDLETVRSQLESRVSPGSSPRIVGDVQCAPRLKRVVASARDAADELKHAYVGTEHVLLALLAEEGATAVTVLKDHGADLERTLIEISKEHGGHLPFPQSEQEEDQVENNVKSFGLRGILKNARIDERKRA